MTRLFRVRYGREPDWLVRAPGRVNLIGEHTDYNDGLVLPCAIDRSTWIAAARGEAGALRIRSEGRDDARVSLAEARQRPAGGFEHWSDYAAGAVAALAEAGHQTVALDLAVASDIPIGAGLSSSAAFGVSLITVLTAAAGVSLPARVRADLAHRAESHFLGVGSGILDPYASALGARDHALAIDCRTREVRPVPIPPGRLCLLLADSGVRRSLAEADSGYRTRVAECRAAVEAVRAAGAEAAGYDEEITSLRDLEVRDLAGLAGRLDPVLLRRARHVVAENERVRDCCAALERGDLADVGAALRAGHRSLRDDYQVSIPELDLLCEIADALPGVHGSRLTGAGWGGCTLHLVEPDAAASVARELARGFRERLGREPPVREVRSAAGAEVVAL